MKTFRYKLCSSFEPNSSFKFVRIVSTEENYFGPPIKLHQNGLREAVGLRRSQADALRIIGKTIDYHKLLMRDVKAGKGLNCDLSLPNLSNEAKDAIEKTAKAIADRDNENRKTERDPGYTETGSILEKDMPKIVRAALILALKELKKEAGPKNN